MSKEKKRGSGRKQRDPPRHKGGLPAAPPASSGRTWLPGDKMAAGDSQEQRRTEASGRRRKQKAPADFPRLPSEEELQRANCWAGENNGPLQGLLGAF